MSEANAPGAMPLTTMLSFDQPQRHALGQVDQAGLAGGVGIGLLRIDRDAVDGRDVDHLGRPRLGAALRSGRAAPA